MIKSSFISMTFVWTDGLFMSVNCYFLWIHACAAGTVNWLVNKINQCCDTGQY